eukprot:evm.model.scf_1903.1 EVM.evm.TU.scf_1903.1   scf_1903:28722-30129(-)
MAAAAVARVAIAGSASKPLLEDPEERKKMTLGEKFKAWFCANPLANLPILLLFSAGVVCIVGAAVGWHVVVAVLGFAALSFGGYQIWALRNLKAEVDRFSKENAKLEETEQSLKQQVSFLEVGRVDRKKALAVIRVARGPVDVAWGQLAGGDGSVEWGREGFGPAPPCMQQAGSGMRKGGPCSKRQGENGR